MAHAFSSRTRGGGGLFHLSHQLAHRWPYNPMHILWTLEGLWVCSPRTLAQTHAWLDQILPRIPLGSFLLPGTNTFSFKKSCVLSLVLETLLIPSKNGLAPQSSRHIAFGTSFPSMLPEKPRWQKESPLIFLRIMLPKTLWTVQIF